MLIFSSEAELRRAFRPEVTQRSRGYREQERDPLLFLPLRGSYSYMVSIP